MDGHEGQLLTPAAAGWTGTVDRRRCRRVGAAANAIRQTLQRTYPAKLAVSTNGRSSGERTPATTRTADTEPRATNQRPVKALPSEAGTSSVHAAVSR